LYFSSSWEKKEVSRSQRGKGELGYEGIEKNHQTEGERKCGPPKEKRKPVYSLTQGRKERFSEKGGTRSATKRGRRGKVRKKKNLPEKKKEKLSQRGAVAPP